MVVKPYYEQDGITIYHGDCRDVLPTLPDGSVDLVLSDPPYGTTANKWDAVIPLDEMWTCLMCVTRRDAAYVFTASQPFTSALVMSNPDWFRHEWIWQKNRGSNFANTVREPMKEHESVLVFSAGGWTYNPQMQERAPGGLDRVRYPIANKTTSENYRDFGGVGHRVVEELRVPSSVQRFKTEVGKHPTQKPYPLMVYLTVTYSWPEQTVLDFACGSGTTLVAARNLHRRAIGIEIEERYCEIAARRLQQSVLPLGA